MSAKIATRQIEGITVLEVSGRITLGEGGVTLRDAIQNALKSGHEEAGSGYGWGELHG